MTFITPALRDLFREPPDLRPACALAEWCGGRAFNNEINIIAWSAPAEAFNNLKNLTAWSVFAEEKTPPTRLATVFGFDFNFYITWKYIQT
jgi:hypothetical protein